MAEDESLPFDLALKKKKKKKKPFESFDIDAAQSADAEATESNFGPKTEITDFGNDQPEEEAQDKAVEDFSLDFGGMRKKKKKKKAFDMDELADVLPVDKTEPATAATDSVVADEAAGEGDEEDFNLALPTKKKKKKTKIDLDNLVAEDEENQAPDDYDAMDGMTPQTMGGGREGKAWLGSDRDYSYDELLTQVFDIMREKNPDMVAGEKKKFVMRPPQVLKVGTRKTSFANFSEICRLLHRQPKHVLAFLLAELGTSGSVDGHNQLIIRGKYNQKQIENVLRRYIKEYVTCHTCRSPDTVLQKDTRIFFLQCETCGSRCSVVSIKSGFQAVTSKRAAIRAKTA